MRRQSSGSSAIRCHPWLTRAHLPRDWGSRYESTWRARSQGSHVTRSWQLCGQQWCRRCSISTDKRCNCGSRARSRISLRATLRCASLNSSKDESIVSSFVRKTLAGSIPPGKVASDASAGDTLGTAATASLPVEMMRDALVAARDAAAVALTGEKGGVQQSETPSAYGEDAHWSTHKGSTPGTPMASNAFFREDVECEERDLRIPRPTGSGDGASIPVAGWLDVDGMSALSQPLSVPSSSSLPFASPSTAVPREERLVRDTNSAGLAVDFSFASSSTESLRGDARVTPTFAVSSQADPESGLTRPSTLSSNVFTCAPLGNVHSAISAVIPSASTSAYTICAPRRIGHVRKSFRGRTATTTLPCDTEATGAVTGSVARASTHMGVALAHCVRLARGIGFVSHRHWLILRWIPEFTGINPDPTESRRRNTIKTERKSCTIKQ
eukprot:Opistho-2@23847